MTCRFGGRCLWDNVGVLYDGAHRNGVPWDDTDGRSSILGFRTVRIGSDHAMKANFFLCIRRCRGTRFSTSFWCVAIRKCEWDIVAVVITHVFECVVRRIWVEWKVLRGLWKILDTRQPTWAACWPHSKVESRGPSAGDRFWLATGKLKVPPSCGNTRVRVGLDLDPPAAS